MVQTSGTPRRINAHGVSAKACVHEEVPKLCFKKVCLTRLFENTGTKLGGKVLGSPGALGAARNSAGTICPRGVPIFETSFDDLA